MAVGRRGKKILAVRKFSSEIQNFWQKILHFEETVRSKIKIFSTVITFVENLQLSNRKMQLPAPPPTFLNAGCW